MNKEKLDNPLDSIKMRPIDTVDGYAREFFGVTQRGETVSRWTLRNAAGFKLRVLDYGCTIQNLWVPDKHGMPVDVVLGYDALESYEQGNCFFGAFVGRYANRIAKAVFPLNGSIVRLAPNDGANHLHGVFSRKIFTAEELPNGLLFHHVSPPEEEGYPGTLHVTVRYLLEDNALRLTYDADTDEDTVLNLTNHTYFNLNGQGDILGHKLRLDADAYTEINQQTIPTGRICPVEGTPMDFRGGRLIGDGIRSDFAQIQMCRGYDHNYVLHNNQGQSRQQHAAHRGYDHNYLLHNNQPLNHTDDHMSSAKRTSDSVGTIPDRRTSFCPPSTPSYFAELSSDVSGIRMQCFTTQPGVQFYTGNYVDEDSAPYGKGGVRYPRHAGVCFETQHFPDSPNQTHFPSVLLRSGEHFHQETVFRFL